MSALPAINPLSTPGLGLVLDGAVQAKRRAPDIKAHTAKLQRVAKKAPEVLVKISGTGKSLGQILAHMTYITRNGKQEAENERGEKVEGLDKVKKLFEKWGFDSSQTSTRQRARTVNIVLSMPEGTDQIAMRNASRAFAQERFGGNHEYLMALHSDTKQPHVHLAVKAQGFDMTLLKRSKADLQEWRDVFAQKLRDHGVEAEATPRRARGVVRKPATQQMHHLAKTPKRSTVIKAKVDEALRELSGGRQDALRPWERAIQVRREQMREAYAKAEQDFRASKDDLSRRAADQLAGFLNALPSMETERARTKRQLATVLETGRVPEDNRSPAGVKSTSEAPIGPRSGGREGRER